MYLTAENNNDVRQANSIIDSWEMWKIIPAERKMVSLEIFWDEEQILGETPLNVGSFEREYRCNRDMCNQCSPLGPPDCPGKWSKRSDQLMGITFQVSNNQIKIL